MAAASDQVSDPIAGRDTSSGLLRGPALALLVTLAAAVTAQGAFYPGDQRLIALPLGVSLVWSIIKFRTLVIPWSLLGAGGALAGWALLLGDEVGDGAGIALIVAGVVVVIMVVASSMDYSERVALGDAVVGLGVAVALSGWWGVAVHSTDLALPGQGLWRASTTLTYANAAAGLIGPIALFAAARCSSKFGRARDLWMIGLFVLVVALIATLSRAGFLSFGCGLLVLAIRLGLRSTLTCLTPLLLGSPVAMVALGPSFPEEATARPALAMFGLVAGMVIVLVVSRLSLGRLVGTTAVVALLGAVVLIAGRGGDTFERISDARLSFSSTDRSEMLRAGIDSMKDDWWTGAGPGNGRLQYVQDNGRFVEARFVHNEYLQIGVELGVIGVILLIALLVSIALGAKKGSVLLPSNVYSGIAAALIALGVQGGFDFLWHIPAIPLVGAALAGIAWPNRLQGETRAGSESG